MNLTPDIWYFEDHPPIYFYSIQQLEYMQELRRMREIDREARKRNDRDLERLERQHSGPLMEL